MNYEKEMIRVKIDGKQVIALTGYTKAKDYALKNYPNATITLECVRDKKIWEIKKPAPVKPKRLVGIKIALDAGHGKYLNYSPINKSYNEADFVFKAVLALKDFLEAEGATVMLTRTAYRQDLPLDKRVNIINKFNPHIALSLHTNAVGSKAQIYASGSEVIVSIKYLSDKFSKFLLEEIVKEFQTNNRGIKWKKNALERDWYYLHRNTKCNLCMVEAGFHDNPADLLKFMAPNAHIKYAQACLNAILKYYNK